MLRWVLGKQRNKIFGGLKKLRTLLVRMSTLLVAFLFMAGTFTAQASSTFTDVGDNHRASKEINYLAEKGIATELAPGQFKPDAPVTRAQAAAMIGRALGLDGTPRDTQFTDVTEKDAYSGYLVELVREGVLSGYNDGTFRPNNTLTRGEMALMLNSAFFEPTRSSSAAQTILMRNGIALGMEDGTFGASKLLIRSDFTVFLARSYDEDFRIPEDKRFVHEFYVNTPGDTLNVRTKPNASAPLVETLAHNTKVLQAHPEGVWAYIQTPSGERGYVHSAYLVQEKSVSQSQTTGGALSKKLIVLDPGHGGHDSGAVGFGYAEKTATLAMAKYAKQYFDQSPFQVAMTRTDDRFISLANRVRFAHNRNADAFISIHINSAGNSSATGLESYYSTSRSKGNIAGSRALTTYIQHRMLQEWGLRNRGVKTAPFYVIRWTNMPSTLLEAGFISNKNDNYKIRTPKHQKQIGRAVYLGTLDYYYHFEGYKNDTAPLYKAQGAKPSPRRH